MAAVLLPVLYVSNYLAVEWLWGRGHLSPGVYGTFNATMFVPIRLYGASGLPGATTLKATALWCQFQGAGNPTTWEKIVQMVE